MVKITKEDIERLVEEASENEKHGNAFLGFQMGVTRLLRLCQQKGVVIDVAAISFLKALFTASMKADRAELEALAIYVKRLRELKHK